jgi:hypothetical protein
MPAGDLVEQFDLTQVAQQPVRGWLADVEDALHICGRGRRDRQQVVVESVGVGGVLAERGDAFPVALAASPGR